MIVIFYAIQKNDDKAIQAIARMSKYTRGFSNMIYSGKEAYENGNVIVAYDNVANVAVGFASFRHCVRKPYSTIYDVGVPPDYMGKGIGRRLVEFVLTSSDHGCVRLNVDVNNKDAIAFYRKLGFKKIGEGAWGKKNPRPYITMQVKTEGFK